jgi:cytochrome c556
VAHAKAPDHAQKENWLQWSMDLKKAGIDLAKAAADKDGKAIMAAVSKANASCASCHKIFKKSE